MESGERLASPSSTPVSVHTSSSSSSSSVSPASNAKSSLNHGAAASLATCGPLFGVTGSEQPFSVTSVTSVPSAFPVMAHPAFGLLSPGTARPEFGGLGALGVTAALAAHPQLGAFTEWWRAAEAHGRSQAAFFPPFLGLPPLFAPPLQNHEATPYMSKTLSRSSQGPKGVNGALNGSVVSPSTTKGSASVSSSPAFNTSASKPRSRKTSHYSNSTGELQEKPLQKPKEKVNMKLRKKQTEGSGVSDSESGSSLDSDIEGVSSSDLDDLGEEDDDEDDDDQSKDSEESDSEKEGQKKKKAKLSPANLRPSKKEHSRVEEVWDPREGNAPPDARSSHVSKSRDRPAQPTSVIQSTGLAVNAKPLALIGQSQHDSSPQQISSSSPRPLPISSHQPLPLSLCSSPKPLSVPSPPKPLPISSSPKPPPLSPSTRARGSTHKSQAPPLDFLSSRKLLETSLSQIADYRLKQSLLVHDQEFPLQLKKQQNLYKTSKTSGVVSSSSSSSSSSATLRSKSTSSRTKPPATQVVAATPSLILSQTLLGLGHANGILQSSTQDTPLALTTKPHTDLPVNLSTGARKDMSVPAPLPTPLPALVPASALPARPRASRKNKTPRALEVWKDVSQKHLVKSLVDLFHHGGGEQETSGKKDSDESGEDDDDDEDDDVDDEDEDEEDEDDSLSESDSNSDSELNGSMRKNRDTTETETDSERTPLKLSKNLSLLPSASGNYSLPDCSPLNLQVIKPSSVATHTIVSGSGALTYHSSPSSSYSVGTSPGSGKRKRVMNEDDLKTPLEMGWRRETRIKSVGGRLQGDVAYYAPCGKRLRQYPDVMKYLSRYGITDITRDNFSFSAKIRVGDFYEAREGPQGLQWCPLSEDEVIPRIRAMEGRRGRPPNSERQHAGGDSEGSSARRRKGRPPNVGHTEFPSASEAKLLRKLEAQEIARQAAQMKLMRKLEKQALARAAKEARKQQAIMAAEERRKQKEQIKILKQQEKIKRIQQIRMEKELRAQQILEAKRKKREEAANAKILEAEKRLKEREMRRQQAVILKHQELERHRLDMERERRRQHVMLMKAVEARKKAEERERLKQEKRDEKRLNKERKLELRRLELEMLREMKKPNEDMCLTDHKPLPKLSRIPGLVLPGQVFSDCLMVVQFLRSFGKVLGMEQNEVPTLGVLQEGLLNLGNSMGQVQDLLVRLLSSAVCDPGLPPGYRAKSILGDHLTNIGLNRDNVSEVLQQYMEAHCAQTVLANMALSLKTKAFQAHTPSQKASVLAFLVNELSCSKSVVSEIDKSLDQMNVLRKDECIVEGKLKKLKNIHAKRTGKREAVGGDEPQATGTPSAGHKRKRKAGDSDEDEDDDEDSDDGVDDEDEDDEEEVKKARKVETCDEDEGDQATSIEELEKQIDKLSKQQNLIRRKLFESSHALRSMSYGQDRYRRRYWVLPQCGGVFVEGMESGEGPEELEKERERLRNFEPVQIKEEPQEEEEEEEEEMQAEADEAQQQPEAQVPAQVKQEDHAEKEVKQEDEKPCLPLNELQEKDTQLLDSCPLKEPPNPPGDLTSLCVRTPDSSVEPVTTATASASSPTHSTSKSTVLCSTPADVVPLVAHFGAPLPQFGVPLSLQHQQHLLANDQLLRVLTERSGHWFSLLPRSPCDDSSLIHPTTTPPHSSAQTSNVQPRSPPASSCSPHQHLQPPSASSSPPNAALDSLGILTVSPLQVKPGGALLPLPMCGWSGGVISPNLPMCSSPMPLCPLTEGSASPLLAPSVSTSKSGSPAPPGDKPLSEPSPAVDLPRNHDQPQPQPIPEDMMMGWWKMTEMEELQTLMKALHSRGIRERALHKQIQKSMELISQTCNKNKEVAVMEVSELDEGQVSVETLQEWCVDEQAMETDIALLQQVEELERRVTSASLQVKGWMHPEPQSEREDLLYYEHKPFSKACPGAESQEERSSEKGLRRQPSNPLDIAVMRLAELERHIERRYLRSPLGTTIQIRLDNVGTVTVPAPAPSTSAGGEGSEEEIAPGMKVWRKALSEVRNSSQLAMCLQQLQKSIAWERSIMKVYCQICRKGDNEDLLLLCDGCDKGCHTYCHKPKINAIPEGDWYCPACISKASNQSPKNKKAQSRMQSGGGGKKSSEAAKKNKKQQEVCEEEEAGGGGSSSTSISSPKKTATTSSQAKKSSPAPPAAKPESPACVKRAKTARDNNRDLGLCRVLLAELERHQDAWPFLTPVNLKSVPGYRKVIKKPMDFSTIREKLVSSQYQNLETFIIDVNLVFDNCEKFNEDNSDIGRAGHNMRKFFEKRWTELLKQTN
ncbi:bromodomain adjacent to zinc finger domain protein 2B isoform X3 [Silurus meridionalis]|uniref:bromodomain adjacent to zinc finger domain protein 2B isoform X3 n=1 Tax=Silurus meridionalis TaxID=175797 RepID=UPI001EEB5FBC|nr:bromodomain adjacent to zinc finger domain protein 2B isoform X3 [Silurus meridionalis]